MNKLKIFNLFPALAVRNYRIFFISQWAALMGLWMQLTAQQWLVYEITQSPLLLGLLSTMQYLPSLLFSLWTGFLIDRYKKKKILFITQFLYMLQAFFLGFILWTGHTNYQWILLFAFLLGTIDCIDLPARMAFMPYLVGKNFLKSAVSLNSTNFNITRMLGPILAAFLLSYFSYSTIFFLDSLCLIPILIMYYFIKVDEPASLNQTKDALWEIKAGISYTWEHKTIFSNLLGVAVVSGLILNFGTYGPPFADQILHAGLDGFSKILFSVGAGSMIGGLLSASGKKVPHQFVPFYSSLLCGLSLVIVSQTSELHLALLLYAAIGFTAIISIVNFNTIIQFETNPIYLGRVMSLYGLVFLGATPFGSLIVSSTIEYSGTANGLLAIGLLDIICILIIKLFYWK